MWGAVSRHIALIKEDDEPSGSASFRYHLGTRGDYCQLDAELAALPSPGEAATADPADILVGEYRTAISKEFILKQPLPPYSPSPQSPRVHVGARRGHYMRIIQRMLLSGMVTILPVNSGAIENSIFGVWKTVNVSQRVIWCGDQSNRFFREEASYVELPDAGTLSQLEMSGADALFVGSCDISQFYNRLRAPDFLVPFLGLPRIRTSYLDPQPEFDVGIPCLRCIPMGATFAVMVAQKVSLSIVKRSGLGRGIVSLASSKLITKTEPKIPVYIDDITVMSGRRNVTNRALTRIIQELRRWGLPIAAEKTHFSTGQPLDSLGFRWWPDGSLSPRPALLKQVIQESQSILSSRHATPHSMRRLNGLWVWIIMLRRCALSVMDQLFVFAARDPQHRSLLVPKDALEELGTLLCLLPLLSCDLTLPRSARLYFSDASLQGAGVVYGSPSNSPTISLDAFSETKVSRGWHARVFGERRAVEENETGVSPAFSSAIEAIQFRTAIRHRWQYIEHINVLEARAIYLAVQHMALSAVTRSTIVPLFVDSTAALGAVAKGRSTSATLNKVCRRIAAVLLQNGFRLELYWVPTASNLADSTSRFLTGPYHGS